MYIWSSRQFFTYMARLCLGTVVVRVYAVVVMRRFDPNMEVKAIDRFEGIMTLSQGQADCIGLASVGLIPTITVLDIRKNWFWITALRPLA